MNRRIIQHLLVMFAVVVVCTSCSSDLPTTCPVSGVVEFDGKPLSGFDDAAVVLTPVGGRLATGTINPKDGTFTLRTFGSNDGALVGPARLTVSATVDDPSLDPEGRGQGVRAVIPTKFFDRVNSGLTCDVVGGRKNFFRIKLASDGTGTIEAE